MPLTWSAPPCPPLPLAVYLATKQSPAYAAATITVWDQAAEQPQHCTRKLESCLIDYKGVGFRQFMSLDRLRSHPTYLTDDVLIIRATVHVQL